MSEDGKETPQNPFDINEHLKNLGELTHVDENGHLRPQDIDAEIRGKVTSIGNKMYIWGRKNADPETINELAEKSLSKLKEMFPEKIDFIKEQMKETDGLNNDKYSALLDEEDK